MIYYAVIDTNVLVSAMLKLNSVPGSIMELAFTGTIVPVYNCEILKEYSDVLHRPKFHFSESVIESVIKEIQQRGILLKASALDISLPDPNDQVFYEVVMEKRKTDNAYLVTGNIKHFPFECFVVTPKEMLETILNDIL